MLPCGAAPAPGGREPARGAEDRPSPGGSGGDELAGRHLHPEVLGETGTELDQAERVAAQGEEVVVGLDGGVAAEDLAPEQGQADLEPAGVEGRVRSPSWTGWKEMRLPRRDEGAECPARRLAGGGQGDLGQREDPGGAFRRREPRGQERPQHLGVGASGARRHVAQDDVRTERQVLQSRGQRVSTAGWSSSAWRAQADEPTTADDVVAPAEEEQVASSSSRPRSPVRNQPSRNPDAETWPSSR